jgi:simple sugar transport system ATP-binding protein
MSSSDAASEQALGQGNLLRLEGVTKRYARVTALRDVSLEIRPAEIVALLGDNGAGKTTIIKIMSGVVQPDEGRIYWKNEEVALRSRGDSVRLGIETIYQDAALIDSMSIARNIFVGRELSGPLGLLRLNRMRQVASEVLDTIVGIAGIDSAEKPVGQLSGGQKQAVAIARAVYFKRTLLLLDEPTSALAVRATEALFEYVRTLRDQGISSVLVTHDLYDAHRTCDRFVVMSRGTVAFEAKREDTTVDELTRIVSRS